MRCLALTSGVDTHTSVGAHTVYAFKGRECVCGGVCVYVEKGKERKERGELREEREEKRLTFLGDIISHGESGEG